jgi:hypothetical protein
MPHNPVVVGISCAPQVLPPGTLVRIGPASSLRKAAPGSATADRDGLLEDHVAPHTRGAARHHHQTFSESCYVLRDELTIHAAGEWQTRVPGDYALVHEHDEVMV